MESLIGEGRGEPMFYEASHHGLVWAILNQLLHFIVFIYTLLGVIKFPVKFITRRKLVDAASRVFIVHNCYLCAKFVLVSFFCFMFNQKLDSYSIEMRALNCSLANYRPMIEAQLDQSRGATSPRVGHARGSALELSFVAALELFIDTFGGPFRLLDNRATLLYGLWSISVYIMLVIFPIELLCFIDVDYNFIKFVLGDTSCMTALYERRERHLLRLASWSRCQTDSSLTKGAKMILSQRDLRSNYTSIAHLYTDPSETSLGPTSTSPDQRRGHAQARFGLELFVEQLISDGKQAACNNNNNNNSSNKQRARLWRLPSIGTALKGRAAPATSLSDVRRPTAGINHFGSTAAEGRLHVTAHAATSYRFNGVKRLKPRLAINHQERPSYRVCVANRNLRRFKPFVRSEAWFKASMLIYPTFMTLFMVFFMVSLSLVVHFLERALWDVVRNCTQQPPEGNEAIDPVHSIEQQQEPSATDWSFWDKLIYYETIYTVFLLSGGSSFYCSYYSGTTYELCVWIRELTQQLELSAHVIELTDVLAHSSSLGSVPLRRHLAPLIGAGFSDGQHHEHDERCLPANEFGGLDEFDLEELGRKCSQLFSFGWLRRARDKHQQHGADEFDGPLSNYRRKEQLAMSFLTKKETLLRAAYVNMCLFFDELNETRPMMTIILRRTVQMGAGFACMLSITRSQYKLNSGEYWYLNSLLLGLLLVFNLNLISAACINYKINKMLVKIHSLVARSIEMGSEDADLLEFWLRHLATLGEDENVTAYYIYGYKITWSAIINFDSLIVTVFFITI